MPVPAVIPMGGIRGRRCIYGTRLTASSKIGAAARGRRPEDDQDGNKASMTAATTGAGLGAGRKYGELSDGCSRRQASKRGIHVNRYFAGDRVQLEVLGNRPALTVGHDCKTLCTVGKLSGRTFGRQGKYNCRSSNRLMVLILDADDRVASDTLANIICGAFALDDDNIEFRGHGLRLGMRKSD